jgi:hypothetical protein
MNTALLPIDRPPAVQGVPATVVVGAAQLHLLKARSWLFNQREQVVSR